MTGSQVDVLDETWPEYLRILCRPAKGTLKHILLLTFIEGSYHQLHSSFMNAEKSHQIWMLEEYLVIHNFAENKY